MQCINNIKICEHPDVYSPCDDTYLLMGSIQINPNEEVLEIGTGTGIIGIRCALLGGKVTTTDINPHAIACAKENVSLNNVKMKIIKSDLFKNVRGTFNVIIFNPPYLPTAKGDHCGGWIDKALDGGKKGDKVIVKFLKNFDKHLKPGGRVYLIVSSLNDPEKCFELIKKKKMSIRKIAEKKLDFETLFVFEIKVS
ncbi:MAG: HemK2/MTQ2 family protein methyltransferase [Thermoplasmata archaeon]